MKILPTTSEILPMVVVVVAVLLAAKYVGIVKSTLM